jgi:heat shock protein HtpX
MGNQIKTTVLLTIMTAFFMFIGHLLGGRQGLIIAFFFAAGMNLFSYWYSDKIVLRMYNAREATPGQAPELYGLVQDLANRAGLPTPRVYIIPQESPNAFATGRNPENAVVAVTEGLLKIMNRDELAGVLGHELAHVKNRDILIGSIAATMAGAIMMLASIARWSAIFGGGSDDNEGMGGFGLIIMSILAPIAAVLIQTAISRSREYMADASGARFAKNNEGLARALEKLGPHVHRQSPFRSKNDESVLNPSALKRSNCKAKGLSSAERRFRSWWRYGSGPGQSVLGSSVQIVFVSVFGNVTTL